MNELRDPALEAWYRAGAHEEPPAALDAAVLAAAHRAVAAKPQPLAAKARQTWSWPVAAAAVLVLSVSIVRLTPTEEVLPAVSESAPPAPARIEADRAAPLTADAALAPVKPQAREAFTAPNEPPTKVPEGVPPVPAQRPEAKPAKRAPATPAQAQAPLAAVTLAETAPAPAADTVLAKAAPAPALPMESRLAGQAAAAREQEGKLAQSRERTEVAAELSYARGAPAPMGLASQSAPNLAKGSSATSAAARQESAEFARPPAAPASVAAASPPAPSAAKREAAARSPAARLAPEAWIRELLRLQAEAPEAEFLAELAAFRAAYPQHALPPPLQAALPRLEQKPPRPFPARN